MNQLDFKWILGLIYGGILTVFLMYQGPENLILNLCVYLIAPLTALVAGFITLQHLGWQGSRAAVLKSVWIALIFWLLGEISTLYFAWKGLSTYPSIADVFFLTGYIFFSRSVILEAKVFELKWNQLNSKVLSLFVATSVLVVGIVSYLAVLGYDAEEGLLVNATTISWSVGDLAMGGLSLILLAMVWTYQGGAVRHAWLWFISAAIVSLIADTIYNWNPAAIVDGSWLNTFLNAMWMLAYFLFAGYFLEIRSTLKKLQRRIDSQEITAP